MNFIEHDIRPWGEYHVIINDTNFKIKQIKVLPNKRLSYQFHNGRAETWVIIKGNARVTIEDVINDYSEGDTIVIPKRAKHRIQNISKKNLVFIEIQTGDYFDEDDIIRLEDDYNRIK